MALLALDVRHKAHAASVVLLLGGVQDPGSCKIVDFGSPCHGRTPVIGTGDGAYRNATKVPRNLIGVRFQLNSPLARIT